MLVPDPPNIPSFALTRTGCEGSVAGSGGAGGGIAFSDSDDCDDSNNLDAASVSSLSSVLRFLIRCMRGVIFLD